MAADAHSIIPGAVLRNLSDKLYEKRKNAALEIEGIVKQLATAGEHEKISAVIGLLTNDFTYSPQANHRKGGLIGLAAVTVGLTSEAAQHLEQIVPPVLNSFLDQDSRVRYYACEALYNIAKVVRGDFIIYFNKIFDALCKLSADADANVQSAAHLLDRLVKDIVTESDQFSIEEFIPLLRERMNVLNPYVRQFLVGWITVLDSVPDIDMLGFLPDFLDGLFNMLSDSSHEIRQQADAALSEFLQEIKNSPNVDYGRMAEILVRRAGSYDEFTRLTSITWMNEFVKLGGEQLVPYYADILGAILPCISDKEEKIRVVARETNEELRAIKADPIEGFDIGAILSIAKRDTRDFYERQMELLKKEIGCMSQGHKEKLESMSREIGATKDFYERQMELLKKEMGCMSQGHQEKLESMSREIGATRDFYERQMELLKKEMRCMSQGHKEGLESIRREMQDFYQKIYPHFSEMSECSQRNQQDSVALMAEISRACGYVQQSPGSRISSNQNCIITLRLQFENSCSTDKYATHEIEADDGTPLKVAIYDSNNRIITYEPFSSMRVHIVAIHGDFDDDHKGQWTEDYLRSNIVLGRPRKEHLLSGKLYFRLQNGVGYLNGVKFQDSSSFVPSKKFKLAVMADDQRITERIQEGITESFAVKDVRGYRYNTVMAVWAGTGQAATVAQLVRAHTGEVISMIIQAAGTARQNKKECEQLARRVFMIADLLPHLQDPDVMQREEIRRPLTGLGDTLREAHELVASCQGRSAMYQFVTAGRQADRFRDVQSRIDSYLLVFPFISHIDVTRRLDRIYNILLPNESQSQLEAAEVAQEVVPLPHGVGAEFTFAELAAATNNFALDTVLGEGSFGTVYKGRLHDGREVAIKRVSRTGGRWPSAHEFRNEMAILSSLRHMHIVRLLGWSVQKEECRLLSFRNKEEKPLLVFEYMNNGSLDNHLHRQTSSSSPVTTSWKMRIEILLGVSRAIEYLHCYAVPPVIHGDIKPSNVLLDASWVPCVSDFGLSVTYDEADEAEVPLFGTAGYMDPEYYQTRRLKPTSDVYNFGVVMLEVLTGKKAIINWEEESKPSVPRTRSRMSLPIFALQSIEAGELGKVLDRRPAVPEPTPRQLEAAELVARTAARCLRLRGEDRPAMSDVVADLETALELVRCGE